MLELTAYMVTLDMGVRGLLNSKIADAMCGPLGRGKITITK